MDWKMKLKDELISRTVIMAVLFSIPLIFVTIPPSNVEAYIIIAGMAVGGGYLKTAQNVLKAKYESKVK